MTATGGLLVQHVRTAGIDLLAGAPPAGDPLPGGVWLDLLSEVVMALAVPVLGLVVLWLAVERLAALLARLATALLGDRDAVVSSVRTGREGMIGRAGTARTDVGTLRGKVFVRGELWDAVSDEPVEAGGSIEVIDMEGLTLRVRPRRDNDDEAGSGGAGSLREEVPCHSPH